MTTSTEHLTLPVDDGSMLPAFLARPNGPPAGGVLIAHELFGVNPDIQAVATALAQEGFLAIAPEFYHRRADPGEWLQRDADGRERGFEFLHALTREDALRDVAATVRYLKEVHAGTNITVVGFSAGGHLAYLAACALALPKTAVLYGGWLTTTDIPLSRPEPTLDLTPALTGTLLYLVGGADHVINAAQVADIRAALDASAAETDVVTYPGVGHAFFWPGTEAFDADAHEDAWQRILRLARQH